MICLFLIFALYFLPTFIAAHRGHRTGGIFVMNLLLGWTGIGWFALVLYALLALPRYVVYAPVAVQGPQYGAWERF